MKFRLRALVPVLFMVVSGAYCKVEQVGNDVEQLLLKNMSNEMDKLVALRSIHDNPYAFEYMKASYSSYEVATDLLKAGSTEQAVVMKGFGDALRGAAYSEIIVARRVEAGSLFNEQELSEALKSSLSEQENILVLALKQIIGLKGTVSTEENIKLFNKAFAGIQGLPRDQQVKQVVSVVARFVLPNPRQSNEVSWDINRTLSQIVKVAKMECVRLKDLPVTKEHSLEAFYAPFTTSLVKAVQIIKKETFPPGTEGQGSLITLGKIFAVSMIGTGAFRTYQYLFSRSAY